MSKRKTFYYGVFGLILLVLIAEVLSTKSTIWVKTFSRYDKNPYGSYALGRVIDDLFPNKEVQKSNLTYFEIVTDENDAANLLSISDEFFLDQNSYDSLLTQVSAGQVAFISSMYMSQLLQDTLGVELSHLSYDINYVMEENDSSSFYIAEKEYAYSGEELESYIESYPDESEIFSTNSEGNPTTIKLPFGKGYFILNTTPIIFTNHFMLYGQNHQAVSSLLSALPVGNLHWTEYYQVGKLNSSSPFRVVLEHPYLKTALYLTLLLILAFMLFEAKRKQRRIPIIEPPQNQTVQFVQTVGNLYLTTENHKAVAINQINFLKEYLSMKMNIHLRLESESAGLIAAKASKDKSFVKQLIEKIQHVESAERISEHTLTDLTSDLHKFYHK